MVFKNLEKEEILKLELRNRIYVLVSKYAGSHLRQLERISKIPYSTLKYHLHFLTRHELIIEKSGNSNIKYYPKTIKSDDIEILSFLKQKNIRRILVFLITSDSCTLKELEKFTKLSSSTISWYIEKLSNSGFVLKKKNGKSVTYTLQYNREKLMKILIAYKESFLDSLVNKAIEMWEVE